MDRKQEQAWKQELARQYADDPGMTIAELAEATDPPTPHKTMQAMILRGVKAGRYKCGRAFREDSAGRRARVPVYRVADEGEDS